MIDLHIHTHASSDGQHSPREIFEMAHAIGLRTIAFADHNSIASVAEGLRLAAEYGMEFFPCLEINTEFRGMDLHLLAYFIPIDNPDLQEFLQTIRDEKIQQAHLRVRRLNELGFEFTWQDLKKFSGEGIPTGVSYLKAILLHRKNRRDPRLRPYIDGDRADSPYFNFYRDFLRHGKPAYVPIRGISTIEAIQRIHRMGAIPVLAHPSDTGLENIPTLVEYGLEGLEAYSSYHDPAEQQFFNDFAKANGLLVTAGSDFHGQAIKPDIVLGRINGNHQEMVAKLKEKHEEKVCHRKRSKGSSSI